MSPSLVMSRLSWCTDEAGRGDKQTTRRGPRLKMVLDPPPPLRMELVDLSVSQVTEKVTD
jgi:hypothetical protein